MATLNTASSIIDYLKGKGFRTSTAERIPLYDTRTSLYNQAGLQLGDYRGTAQQNTALLQYLANAERSAGVSLNPENINQIIQVARGSGSSAQPSAPASTAPAAPPANIPATPGATAVSTISQTTPTTFTPSAVLSQEQLDAIYDPLKGRDVAAEALQQVQSGATFPLQQESIAANKAAVELGAQRDTNNLINTLASRGLFFSGKKKAGVDAIEVDKLASLLKIDRDYAMLLAKGVENAAQQIVKEAQAGSREALNALDKLGYGINPLNGAVEPTLAARKAAEQSRQFEVSTEVKQEQFEAQQALREAQYELSVARTQAQLEQAQQRIELATARYELAVAKSQNGGAPSGGNIGGTLKDAEKAGYTRTFNSAGGINFMQSGKPVTLTQWLSGSGVTIDKALEGSTDNGDLNFLAAYKRGLKAIEDGFLTVNSKQVPVDADMIMNELRIAFPRYFGGQSSAPTATSGGGNTALGFGGGDIITSPLGGTANSTPQTFFGRLFGA